MACIYPHQMFQRDLLLMFKEVQRQESLDPFHSDETELGKELWFFFAEDVLPLIKSDERVYNAAKHFASEYAFEYFRMLEWLEAVKSTQRKLAILRAEVTQFIKTAIELNCAPSSMTIAKLSDFITVLDFNKLHPRMKTEAKQLYEETIDLEYLYVDVASQAIQAMYEKGMPRIFFVVKKALETSLKAKKKSNNMFLEEPSAYLNWCKQCLESDHIILRTLIQHREFYRVVRNVQSHKTGPQWLPDTSEVYLPDRDEQLTVGITEFSQRYRYLMYFCEIGARGILAMFCDREQGAIANSVKNKYIKIFDNPELKERLCDYPV